LDIKDSFDIKLWSAEITNILTKDGKKGNIERVPGEKKGAFKHKKVHT
jgi:hypothetical protein